VRNTVLVDARAIVAILSRGDHFHAVDSDVTVYRLPDRSKFTVIPGGKG